MTDKTPANDQAEKEWADLQRDLDTLGEQLGSLRDHFVRPSSAETATTRPARAPRKRSSTVM